MKKVWLINQYAMPPNLEARPRTIKFAHYLTTMGYDVTIFASSVMHNMQIDLIHDNRLFIEKKYDDLKFVHIKIPKYSKNGFARIIGLIEFPVKLFFIRKKFDKPDIIIHTATVPFGNLLYYCAKRLKATYIAEILDLWPESFVDLGILKKWNPFLHFSYIAEKWLYNKADKVVFSMEGGKDYIVYKKWDKDHGGPIDLKKVFYINNGVDLIEFNFNREFYKLEDNDLENDKIKKIVYIGSMRRANNILELVMAAKLLKDYPEIKFLLYGDGEDREPLETYCRVNALNNVIFKQKWVDPHYVPYILSKSTLNILNYKSGFFGKYGGSQSKLFQYLASGKPICSNIEMMYCLISKWNFGISKEFNSDKEYAEAILYLVSLDKIRSDEISESMIEVVKEFDYFNLTKKLVELF